LKARKAQNKTGIRELPALRIITCEGREVDGKACANQVENKRAPPLSTTDIIIVQLSSVINYSIYYY
jgi:hypothetical protein